MSSGKDSVMDPMVMKVEQHHGVHHEEELGAGSWIEIAGDHSSHNSPLQEFNGFTFASNTHVPLEPYYNRPMQPSYSTAQPLQPLVMPQWPSQLTNPSLDSGLPPAFPPPRPLAPISTMPPKPPLPRSASTPAPVSAPSTARRTLTDQDRRKMCQYHEDHPTVKQTEIGGKAENESYLFRTITDMYNLAMFGVERSTVSKVLRQKEKYLYPDDGSRSPIKRSKGKFPDIERALSNWAKNHQQQGLPLSDEIIRDKARFFATTVGTSDCHVKVNSPIWLEKFKQKNSLLGAKSRKAVDGQEADSGRNSALKSGSQTPNGISPISPETLPPGSPPDQGQEDTKTESPISYMDLAAMYRHHHSQSATSLGSSYTEQTGFSDELRSPTSPFFSPMSSAGPSPCLPAQQARLPALASANSRPRRQTFPVISTDPSFGTPPHSSEPASPKGYQQQSMAAPTLESPIEEMEEPPLMIDSTMHQQQPSQQTDSPAQNNSPLSMAPPPNPSASPRIGSNAGSNASSPSAPPSQDEARRALEVLMAFFHHQPNGAVDPQEYITMGKLMEKLKLQGTGLPGGMHRVEREGGRELVGRKRSIHSLS